MTTGSQLHMAPGGLGLTVYRWLRQWAWGQMWRKRW